MSERIFLAIVQPDGEGIAIAEVIHEDLTETSDADGERIAHIVFTAMAKAESEDEEFEKHKTDKPN